MRDTGHGTRGGRNRGLRKRDSEPALSSRAAVTQLQASEFANLDLNVRTRKLGFVKREPDSRNRDSGIGLHKLGKQNLDSRCRLRLSETGFKGLAIQVRWS